jgi:hypothetical protein
MRIIELIREKRKLVSSYSGINLDTIAKPKLKATLLVIIHKNKVDTDYLISRQFLNNS